MRSCFISGFSQADKAGWFWGLQRENQLIFVGTHLLVVLAFNGVARLIILLLFEIQTENKEWRLGFVRWNWTMMTLRDTV